MAHLAGLEPERAQQDAPARRSPVRCTCPSCRQRHEQPAVQRAYALLRPRHLAALGRCLAVRLRARGRLTGHRFFLGPGADLQIGPGAHVRLGQGVCFLRDFTGHFYGRVEIGEGVFFNRGCHVVAHTTLSIGRHCLFGEGVSIHDDNHVPGRGPEPIATRGVVAASIAIGANVWVGAKATILAGVTIGDNAVIGAHAVVTRDIPAGTIAAGIPARAIRPVDGAMDSAGGDRHRG